MSPVILFCRVLLTCYLLTISIPVICMDIYTNQWAVEIEGGHGLAEEVARKHGFKNLGQIGNLANHYLFKHKHVFKRSLDANIHHHTRLKREPTVLWTEQQIIKKRVKRGFEETITDPTWPKQWYLHGGASRGYDMNVIPVWEKGITGKGVVVTILDDGIERDHPDLIDNYDPDASYDVNSHDEDPMPRETHSNENRHGTRCAGEVSAGLNSYCGVGVAYNSRIGGVRMLDGEVTDAVEAASLSYNIQHIDIYSASWGPDDDGKVVDGPGRLAKKSFSDGVKNGRGGKGSIFVWASGNGGAMKDSCSCDGYSNSIYTLSISSTSERGRKPWYLEECASTLATTYSSGENYKEKQIVTTDLHKKCTDKHTGTSASAPLAAGLLALALEVNPELTWRDAQYIVLMTSRPDPMIDGDWIENGVGRKVSHKYGYGLMDADAMVELARDWTVVPEKYICEELIHTTPLEVVNKLVLNITSTGCAGRDNAVKYLEHVQLKVNLRFPRRGDAQVNLISPSKTKCNLLPRRNNDYNRGEFKEWPFLSVFFWGEDPTGNWTVEFENTGYETNKGLVERYQLILQGTQINPVRLKSATNSSVGNVTADRQPINTTRPVPDNHPSIPQTVEWDLSQPITTSSGDGDLYQPITQSSGDGDVSQRVAPSSGDGDIRQPITLTTLEDVTQFVPTSSASKMTPIVGILRFLLTDIHHTVCLMLCAVSSGVVESYQLILHGTRVYPIGRKGEMPTAKPDEQTTQVTEGNNSENGEVSLTTQMNVVDINLSDKTHVKDGDITDLDSENEATPEEDGSKGFWHFGKSKPTKCHPECEGGCSGPKVNQCKQCKHFTLSGSCVASCPETGYYGDTVTKMCTACHASCQTCKGTSETECLTCPHDLYLNELTSTCTKACGQGYYADESNVCTSCSDTCLACAESSDHCIQCKEGQSLQDSKCVTSCLAAEFMSPSGCMQCHIDCMTCSGPGIHDCLTCDYDYFLLNGSCQSHCNEEGYYGDKTTDVWMCKRCHASCQTCSGPDQSDCDTCPDGIPITNGQCTSTSSTLPPSSCRAGQYKDAFDECHACDDSCETCHGASDWNCLVCARNRFMYRGQCVETCHDGYFPFSNVSPDGTPVRQCKECHVTCKTCTGEKSSECASCLDNFSLVHGVCKSQCLPGQYKDTNDACVPCHIDCGECTGSHDNECLECDSLKFLHHGKCLETCPDGYYGDDEATCQACDASCQTCSGDGITHCTSCSDGKHLSGGQCQPITAQPSCSSGEYYDDAQKRCELCDITCRECSGSLSTDCSSCDNGNSLRQGECVRLLEDAGNGNEIVPVTNSPVQTQKMKPPESNESTHRGGDDNRQLHEETPPKTDDQIRIRTAATINKDGSVNIETPALTKDKTLTQSNYAAIAIIIVCCVFATIIFFTIFGVLQARSNGKWCFRSVGYQKVPTRYDTGNDRILLTANDFDDEDEIF